MMKDFLSISSCQTEELLELLELSDSLKKFYKKGNRDLCLAGKSLVMLFEKPSLRTRMSFQIAMSQLGGSPIYVKPEDIGGIGKREPIKDMARVLDRMANGIMARTFAHDTVVELANYANIPVINALTDWSHPCQAMADIMTVREHFGKLEGVKIAYIGDGNNVARSLAFVCAKLKMKLVIASPKGYELDNESVVRTNEITPDTTTQMNSPAQAVKDAQVIYTDTWVSMGQEDEKQKRIADFQGFAVDAKLLSLAPDAKIMHCLPAYRGLEISDEAMECPNSIVFDEAENRLHFQRALLKKLLS
ncbi:MAG: ornithine carbamoyltransferase [Planctomycetaceae bacterium]|nr:ornithine carbamoyltransferase [Planctomycetaceae bacterium]